MKKRWSENKETSEEDEMRNNTKKQRHRWKYEPLQFSALGQTLTV